MRFFPEKVLEPDHGAFIASPVRLKPLEPARFDDGAVALLRGIRGRKAARGGKSPQILNRRGHV